jgi:hypothetical protein
MRVDQIANLSLPSLTNAWHHTKSTNGLACVDAYQSLPYFSQRRRNHLVVLDWSTNAYQSADLGQTFELAAFTNHYHRGLDNSQLISV